MGLNLSAPITTMHVERNHTPIFNAACVHLHGWRLTQEDAHNIIEDTNDNGIMLFGVYDGHGGSLAAQYLQLAIPAAFKGISSLADQQAITRLMLDIDAEFIAKQHQDGTTCCIVLAQLWDTVQNTAIAMPFDVYFEKINYNTEFLRTNTAIRLLSINIGDSRAMIVTSDSLYPTKQTNTPNITETDSQLTTTPVPTSAKKRSHYVAITRDHKPQNDGERQRIVNAMGTVSGNRVDGSLALSRAIGDAPYKADPLLSAHQQKVIAVPEYQTHTIYWGDVLLVCCDGLFEADRMTYAELAKITAKSIQSMVNMNKFIVPIDEKNGQMGNDVTNDTTSKSDTLAISALASDVNDDCSTPEYADWDPAIVARDLIEQSLLAESKDNHTAIVVSFRIPKLVPNFVFDKSTTQRNAQNSQNSQTTPPIENSLLPTPTYTKLENTFVPSLLNYLPSKECVPGPYAANAQKDSEWAEVYKKDLEHQGYTLHDVKSVLDILDSVISQHCGITLEAVKTKDVTTKVIEAMNKKLGKGGKADGEKSSEDKKSDEDGQIAIVAPILMKGHLFRQGQDLPQGSNLDTVFHHILRSAQASSRGNLLSGKQTANQPF